MVHGVYPTSFCPSNILKINGSRTKRTHKPAVLYYTGSASNENFYIG